eukprot:6465974-Amphidinium_carterae.1
MLNSYWTQSSNKGGKSADRVDAFDLLRESILQRVFQEDYNFVVFDDVCACTTDFGIKGHSPLKFSIRNGKLLWPPEGEQSPAFKKACPCQVDGSSPMDVSTFLDFVHQQSKH